MSQVGDFLAHDTELPAHEVNYEQSMVAPLLHLLLTARQIDPASVPDEELRRRLHWLTAFAAHQSDPRVHHIPIRHWDDYWFGALRMWGDVFPHYWSVGTASTGESREGVVSQHSRQNDPPIGLGRGRLAAQPSKRSTVQQRRGGLTGAAQLAQKTRT
jgi:hypothetical protein